MPKSRKQVLFKRNLIPCQLRTPVPPFMWLPQSQSQSLSKNQIPSQSMPVWPFQRADTTDPVKRLSEGKQKYQRQNTELGPRPWDTVHICTIFRSTVWRRIFTHACEMDMEVRLARCLACSAANTDTEQRATWYSFPALWCSWQSGQCGSRLPDFSRFTGMDMKIQNQKARTSSAYLRQPTNSPKVWKSLHFGCLSFVLGTDPDHLPTWSRLCASVSLSEWRVNSLLYTKHSKTVL